MAALRIRLDWPLTEERGAHGGSGCAGPKRAASQDNLRRSSVDHIQKRLIPLTPKVATLAVFAAIALALSACDSDDKTKVGPSAASTATASPTTRQATPIATSAPSSSFSDGTYLVPGEVARGWYRNSGTGRTCWVYKNGSTSAHEYGDGQLPMHVDASWSVFRSENCGTWSVATSTELLTSFEKQVVYDGTHSGLLCRPDGAGPFSAVMFNHGGVGGVVGGAPEETCRALKEAGYLGFAPIRTDNPSTDANLENVYDAFEYLTSLEYVDTAHMGLIGFSRGVLLTYNLAALGPGDIQAVVLMTGGIPEQLIDDYASGGDGFSASVLLLVAENDTPSDLNGQQNMVEVVNDLKNLLDAQGAATELIIYPPYQEGHGHTMFFEVGDYWDDVLKFLTDEL